MTNPDNQRLNTTEKTGVFQPNQVVALGLKTNPDDLMTTEKTGIFDGTVSQFLTLSLQTQSKELLGTFIRDISLDQRAFMHISMLYICNVFFCFLEHICINL